MLSPWWVQAGHSRYTVLPGIEPWVADHHAATDTLSNAKDSRVAVETTAKPWLHSATLQCQPEQTFEGVTLFVRLKPFWLGTSLWSPWHLVPKASEIPGDTSIDEIMLCSSPSWAVLSRRRRFSERVGRWAALNGRGAERTCSWRWTRHVISGCWSSASWRPTKLSMKAGCTQSVWCWRWETSSPLSQRGLSWQLHRPRIRLRRAQRRRTDEPVTIHDTIKLLIRESGLVRVLSSTSVSCSTSRWLFSSPHSPRQGTFPRSDGWKLVQVPRSTVTLANRTLHELSTSPRDPKFHNATSSDHDDRTSSWMSKRSSLGTFTRWPRMCWALMTNTTGDDDDLQPLEQVERAANETLNMEEVDWDWSRTIVHTIRVMTTVSSCSRNRGWKLTNFNIHSGMETSTSHSSCNHYFLRFGFCMSYTSFGDISSFFPCLDTHFFSTGRTALDFAASAKWTCFAQCIETRVLVNVPSRKEHLILVMDVITSLHAQ